jgi:hypothetical protein
MFFKRQVFVNVAPGVNVVPSGTVTSETNWAQSHVALADAFECVIAAGTSENNIAQSKMIEATLIRDFITASSIPSKYLERKIGQKGSKLASEPTAIVDYQKSRMTIRL